MTQLIVRASDILRGHRAAKFTKPCKILQNSVEILSNTYLYNICNIWNISQLLGLFTCRKLVNLSWNFDTKMRKQRPETTRCRSCCEKLGTNHDVKGFAIVSVLERIVVERAKFHDLCKKNIKNAGLWSAQNWSISNKVFPKNNHKIGLFSLTDFWLSLSQKIPRNQSIFPRNCP